MKKLLKSFKWVDDNLVHIFLIFFLLATALVPKIPIFHIEYTYIRGRYDDFFIIPVVLVFIIQLLRKKAHFNAKFLTPILLFWFSILVSFIVGYYIQGTIPIRNQGILHALRRVQYMVIFFVASSSIVSKERFMQYMKLFLVGVFVVSLYGIGQRFFQFPSIQSMNPAYVDGRLLFLNPEDRINSTFGGHFDLAAYLVFSIPILFGFYFYARKLKYFLLYILSLIVLLFTSARSSFGGYIVSISLMLLYLKKYLLYFFVLACTGILLFATGVMTKRFAQLFQIKTVFVNTETGQTKIDQSITTENLPAGNLKINIPKGLVKKGQKVDEAQIKQVALEQAMKEAVAKGNNNASAKELDARANEIAKFIQPQRTLLCDISCSTRFQVEWPRAISHFLYNPFFGTGPSSLGEATDNSFLRWLGEFGLLGSIVFLVLLLSIVRYIWKATKKAISEKYLLYGFVFGVIGLLVNALYSDTFEASKVAYTFWTIAGFYVGFVDLLGAQKKKA